MTKRTKASYPYPVWSDKYAMEQAAQKPSTAPEPARIAFEAARRERDYSCTVYGDYINPRVNSDWIVWQTAWAAALDYKEKR